MGLYPIYASLVAQMIKRPPAMWETHVRSLGREDPLQKEWQSTPALLPGKPHGWRSLIGYSPWGSKESDTTEPLHFRFILFMGISVMINTGPRDQKFPSVLLKMLGNVSAGRLYALSASRPCSTAIAVGGSHHPNSLSHLCN